MNIDLTNAVRMHESRPAAIKAAKEKMPVAYFGLGILEWHGLHNIAGLDGVKADLCCRYLCSKFGGVVVPPLFWGDHRGDICELVFNPDNFGFLTFDHTVPICENMGYDKDALEKNARRSELNGGWKLFVDLMVHNFFQLESFGFKQIIVLPGHYPLFGPVETAAERYRKEGGVSGLFVLKDSMYSDDGSAGDHAAAFETSLMLALCPESVDLSALSSDLSEPNIGVLGEDPRLHASAGFGYKILEKFEQLTKEYLTANGL
jgi:creatinine amidohydrolase/Fe(II)-dependent formamide hydrolase-like protein